MEDVNEKSPFGKTCEVQEETKKQINGDEEEEEEVDLQVHAEIQKEDKLKSAKAKVGEIREENERLSLVLAQMVKDYQALHTHFLNMLQQEEAKKFKDTSAIITHDQENEEESELVSLSLGRSAASSSDPNKKDDQMKIGNLRTSAHGKEGLGLGLLDCRLELNNSTESENTLEEVKEEEPLGIWPPSKILKTKRSDQDEEVFEQTQLKKARVSVRARCATPTMNDGCHWRKYGQKIAKGNPCPRAYYRCTISPNCPVRKQVQRWAEDMSILITTYEGTHNHPLPISATAMASTTSAAASMLQCHSSTSQTGLGTSVSAVSSTSNTANLHGLNFTFSETSARPHQVYFPNSSISNSNSHPTIVLDLTSPASFSHINRFSSTPTCLNFSSPSSTISPEPKTLQTWSNHEQFLGKQQPREHIYQPYRPMNNLNTPPQPSMTETIAATKKVITSNPNFQSVLAAAISSYIGNGGITAQQGESSGLDLKWVKSNFPVKPADSSAQNDLGFASSILNKVPSSPKRSASIFPLNSLPFSTPKSS